jgi:hypothetical protein
MTTLEAISFPVDVRIENHFSVYLLLPLTYVGRDWLRSHVASDAQWFGDALVCEPRYVADIAKGAVDDGLVVR